MGPDNSNCDNYGVFDMATANAYLVLMPTTLLLASVNLVNLTHTGSYTNRRNAAFSIMSDCRQY